MWQKMKFMEIPCGTNTDSSDLEDELTRMVEDLSPPNRLKIAAKLIEDVAFDRAGLVDTGLIATLIRIAACLEDKSRVH